MEPEQILQLQRLQQRIAEVGRLARDMADGAPHHVEGSDATGWVRIVVGRGGLPTEIRVREGWQQRLYPDRLASAVTEAYSDAMQGAMRAWVSAVNGSGWWRCRATIDEVIDAHTAHGGQALPELPFGHARDVNDLAEEVMRQLQGAQPSQAASPASVEGHDEGHVSIQLGPGGLTACTIAPDWAEHRDGAAISAALATALRRAVAAYPPSQPAGFEPDTLIGDALATLTCLAATPPTLGGNG